jgi:hypothetical protein
VLLLLYQPNPLITNQAANLCLAGTICVTMFVTVEQKTNKMRWLTNYTTPASIPLSLSSGAHLATDCQQKGEQGKKSDIAPVNECWRMRFFLLSSRLVFVTWDLLF